MRLLHSVASVKFQSGPVARLGERWPAAIGYRRHSSAQSDRPQTVFTSLSGQRIQGQLHGHEGTVTCGVFDRGRMLYRS